MTTTKERYEQAKASAARAHRALRMADGTNASGRQIKGLLRAFQASMDERQAAFKAYMEDQTQ